MEIKFISPQEKNNWDTFVSAHQCGHFMQSYAWGAMRELQGWGVHRLMVVDKDVPLAGMTLLSKQIPGLGKKIVYCPRGPLFDADNPEALSLLLQSAWKLPGTIMLRMDPYFPAEDPRCAVMQQCGCTPSDREWSYWNNPRYVLWLDISAGQEAYMQEASSAFRTESKKPVKSGVVFRTGARTDLLAFTTLMQGMAKNKNIAVHDSHYYTQLYDTLYSDGLLELFLAEYEGVIISVGMSIKYGNKAWLLYAASAKEYSKLGASLTLQLRMLEWAMSAGCVLYDFRGSATLYPPNPSDPGYGVYKFKKKFRPEFQVLAPYYDFSPTFFSKIAAKSFDSIAVPLLYKAMKIKNTN